MTSLRDAAMNVTEYYPTTFLPVSFIDYLLVRLFITHITKLSVLKYFFIISIVGWENIVDRHMQNKINK